MRTIFCGDRAGILSDTSKIKTKKRDGRKMLTTYFRYFLVMLILKVSSVGLRIVAKDGKNNLRALNTSGYNNFLRFFEWCNFVELPFRIRSEIVEVQGGLRYVVQFNLIQFQRGRLYLTRLRQVLDLVESNVRDGHVRTTHRT